MSLATQTSVDRLAKLVQSLATWTGPVSVVVFVPDAEFDVAQAFISYLRSCHQVERDARQVQISSVFRE